MWAVIHLAEAEQERRKQVAKQLLFPVCQNTTPRSEWMPDMPLRADPNDEQIWERACYFWRTGKAAAWSDIPSLVAREFAAPVPAAEL